ncbi:hypothetical protein PoB_005459800 [Plakobranchus ocellatus]|uniref:Uncharacterized protein n=1 Tax=Plakobranchus ocellatus TaxID=259542 RepID=A0AAV4CAT5_9GAST|nr:hypothetical protein PoB_005459800 [Plakobranchus ocellatus]
MPYNPFLLLVSVLIASYAAGDDSVSVVLLPPYRPGFPVIVRCYFDNAESELETVNSLKIVRSADGDPSNYQSVATTTPDDDISDLGDRVTVVGIIDPDYESFVSASIPHPDAYCYNYKCTATGQNSQGQSVSIEHTKQNPCV